MHRSLYRIGPDHSLSGLVLEEINCMGRVVPKQVICPSSWFSRPALQTGPKTVKETEATLEEALFVSVTLKVKLSAVELPFFKIIMPH